MAIAWACGVEPIPASLENRPLETPYLIAFLTVIPAAPPRTALGLKAPTNTCLIASSVLEPIITSIMIPPSI